MFINSVKMAPMFIKIQNQLTIVSRNKSQKMKKLNFFLKSMYGDLLETKSEKTVRLKLEKEGKIKLKYTLKEDSEFPFFLNKALEAKLSSIMKDFKNKIKKGPNRIAKKVVPFQRIQLNGINKESVNVENEVLQKSYISKDCKSKNNNGPNQAATKVVQIQRIRFNVTDDKNKETLNIENEKNSQQQTCEVVNEKTDEQNGILSTPLYSCTAKKSSMNDEVKEIMRLSPKDHKEYKSFPSVTNILNVSMSEESKAALDRWEKQMIAKLGIEGFKIYRQDLLRNGKFMHSAIQNHLLNKPVTVHENVKLAFSSLNNVLKDISSVRAIESHVVHPQLHYRGYFDCVASYRGNLCVIDWKKSDKPKSSIMSTYDAPLQVASYIGALNTDEKYPFEIKHGLIVVAYTSGAKATVHEISGDLLQLYWKSWLQRLQKYQSEAAIATPNAEIKSDL